MTHRFNKIFIINPAKVASASFYHGLNNKFNCMHGHNLDLMRREIDNNTNCLFICGVRNPITRNESYFFQTKNDKYYNDFKTKKNNYEGEYCYNEYYQNLIDKFKNRDNKYSYLDWLEEFLDITQIKNYNKSRGYEIYNIKNNNRLLVYTFEKLKNNKCFFEKWLDFRIQNRNINISSEYKKFKKNIIYDTEYINKILNNDLIRFFYEEKDIYIFYNNAVSSD